MSIAEEIVRPEQCALLVTLPMDKETFESQLRKPHQHDYVHRYKDGGWGKYVETTADFLSKKLAQIEELGCAIFDDAQLTCLNSATRDQHFRVVVVLGHWTGDALEFFDGLHHPQAIVGAIHDQFDGFIDLCVCHPVDIARALDTANDRVLVRFSHRTADPLIWIVYLLIVFKILSCNNCSYLKALNYARDALLEEKDNGHENVRRDSR